MSYSRFTSSSKSQKTLVIAIHGACFGDNFGDTLLLQLLTRILRAEFPQATIAIPFAPPKSAAKIGADVTGIKYLFRSDAFVFGGGGYFGEPDRGKFRWSIRNFLRYILPGLIVTCLRKPLFIVGVGAGPIASRLLRRSIKRIFSCASFAAVRDSESKAFVTEIGVNPSKLTLTADLALAIADMEFREQFLPELAALVRQGVVAPQFKAKIGIHFNQLSPGSFEQKMSDEMIRHFGFRSVVAVNDQGDQRGSGASSRSLAPSSPDSAEASTCIYQGLAQFIHEISQMDVVLTKKLHVGIIASAMGVPAVAVPRHSKISRLYRQIGKAHCCIPADEANAETVLSQIETVRAETWQLPRHVIEDALTNLSFLPILRALLDPTGLEARAAK
jgi:polysaccharide pyruvyl transferase WcaK-like protein